MSGFPLQNLDRELRILGAFFLGFAAGAGSAAAAVLLWRAV